MSPHPNPAPIQIDTVLSTEWLSTTLGVDVSSVEVVESMTTVATKVRMKLTVDDNPDTGTLDVFVKAMLAYDPLPPFYARISQTEARFYREAVADIGIQHPPVRYIGIDPANGHGLLLMDDIKSSGATFLTALSPYTRDQASASLDQLARLHASHWNGEGLDRHPWIESRFAHMAAQPWRTDEELAELLGDGRTNGLAAEVSDVGLIHRSLRALSSRLEQQPETIVHGDPHAGNLFEQDGHVSLIDWQVVQRTHWSIDVAYHIAAVLSIEDRRAGERDLLEHYLDRLRAYGVDAPAIDDAFTAYRQAMVYGLYLWAVTRKVERSITVELTQRLGTAVTDLETFSLLGS